MTRRYGVMLVMLCASAVVIAECSKESTAPDRNRDVLGPVTNVGNGTARTFVILQDDKPVSLGIELSDGALQNLPATPTEWQLSLPQGVQLDPYDHATLNWNPQGHPPPGIYMVPHFDFHFYMITPAEQAAVQGGPDNAQIASQYVPPGYVPDPVAVPGMGVHWTDSQAAEFHGQPFTSTFIYGSHNGQFTFIEPMVTQAYLQSHANVEFAVKQPQAVQKGGLYPTHYSVRYDAADSMLRVALDSLATRH